jgi:23S rRNA pseudouridine1911/1915/1917 synthase
MRTIKYKINYDTTIYNFLSQKEKYSSRLITSLRKNAGGILKNGIHTRTVDEIKQGDELTVNIPDDDTDIPPVNLPLKVVYEDEDVLIADKPAFTVCHPTRNHQNDTLANAVAYYLEQKGKKCTFRAVNRLDRDTTGLVVIALNRLAAERLAKSVKKTYFALAAGNIPRSGTINLPIARKEPLKILREVSPDGQKAVTHYKVIKNTDKYTLLEIKLETGRTHQIRVHFAAIGHPLIGDTMYGTPDEVFTHQCLHCGRVEFIQPITGETKIIVSKPDFIFNDYSGV